VLDGSPEALLLFSSLSERPSKMPPIKIGVPPAAIDPMTDFPLP